MNREQESLKIYWKKRLILPTICVTALLVCLLAGFVLSNTRAADQRTLQDTVGTLSLVLADPILTKDQLEILKRISSVATKQDLSVVVNDITGQVLGAFPPLFEGQHSLDQKGLTQPIYSNNGAMLGNISAVRMHPTPFINSIAIFTALLVLFFGLIIFWIIRTVRPIFDDVLCLTSAGLAGEIQNAKEFRFSETQNTFETLQKQSGELVEREKEKLLVSVAAEVAHNIRSPVAALDNMVAALPQLSEADRMNINGSITSIRDIANSLLSRLRSGLNMGMATKIEIVSSGQTEETTCIIIGQFIEQFVSEKRFEFGSKEEFKIKTEIPEQIHFQCAQIQRTGLKSLLSNLVNNAAEAMKFNGSIVISVKEVERNFTISIADSGPGIPSEILNKLGSEQVTYNKPNGTGLGLLHAFESVKRWNGALSIESKLGQGTNINVNLPTYPTPYWFLSELWINRDTSVVVLDDSLGIHKAWESRFNNANHGDSGIKLLSFSKFDDLMKWHSQNPRESADAKFLIDFDFGDPNLNGLDVIEILGIRAHAFLVTSHFDETKLQNNCTDKFVRMIPKSLISTIPIKLMAALEKPDAIFVDDDKYNHELWETESPGKDIRYYFNGHDFLEDRDKYSKATPIFVDFNFEGQALQGDFITEAASHHFKYVHLATNMRPAWLPQMPWLKEIRGKLPPWASGA